VRGFGAAVCAFVALTCSPAASADEWLPHPADATWTYQWSDSVYAPTPTTEQVTVKSTTATAFTLAWTTDGLNNPDGTPSSNGTVDFQETNSGLNATTWSSTPPPDAFPVLCSQLSGCGNSLSSVLYNVIWGSRQPVLEEPLQLGLSWTTTGGAANDVAGVSTYLGNETITVPAFSAPVTAAKVQTKITQAGAIGDPYGSGTRTIWWVAGVGPVKIEFDHAGGGTAPVTSAVLLSTNQTPPPPPSNIDYFPLTKGLTLSYRWTNTKHLPNPEIEKFTVDAVVNNTARFTVKSVSGPIKVSGNYGYSKRLDGVTNLWGTTSSATLATFPPLGPTGAAKAKRNHFATPFDLMNFGLNPILTAYPATGDEWSAARSGDDFTTYGVSGSTRVIGIQTVKVPAGTFQALVLRSQLTQPGFPYGSGTRTTWLAPGKGLVKLVFAHGDGSVSTVELIK